MSVSNGVPNLELYRRRLERRQRELQAFVRESGDIADAPVGDPAQLLPLHARVQISPTFLERSHQELARVRRALAAIENGTFGVCQQCHQLIAPIRLDEAPDATLCLWCANR